ncbi:MAG: hypothetical protein NDI61_03815 [Bdellovibrionaceae bacterium]|nr:hypothetical protein [Pseudobdellovibrionaceae bacterium]
MTTNTCAPNSAHRNRDLAHVARFTLALFASLILFAQDVHAGGTPGSLTYQGRILKPDGSPLESNNVQFTLQVRSPGSESCLLYEETHIVNMAASDGVFSLVVGAGTPTANSLAYTLSQVFDNSMPLTGLNCATGNSYTPSTGASRKFRVSFDDGTAVVAITPDHDVQSVPYALHASQLEGLGKASFIQVNTATSNLSQANANQLFQPANFTELMNLLNGTSTQYAKSIDLPMSGAALDLSTGGVIVPNTPPSATSAVNRTYVDATLGGKSLDVSTVGATAGNGKVLTWDQAANKWVVADVTDASKLPLAGGTMSGTLNMGGNNILSSGHLQLSSQKTLLLGTYTAAQETALTASLTVADKGRFWFNTDTNELRFWNGSAAQNVGIGTVTNVTGTAPISVATGTSTPVISIADATAASKGAVQVGSGLAIAAGVVSADIGTTSGKIMGADAVPQCLGTQKLQMSAGPTFAWSCVADQGLTAETDPSVQGFAKAAPPTCAAGQVLKSDGTNLSCVADAGLTSETDPSVQAFAKSAPPTCGAGQVLKSDGTNLSCVADSATDTSKLPLAGGTMSGTLNMGGQDISAAGNVALNAQKTFGLGIYTNGEETTLIGGLAAGDKGKTWYNSTSNQIKYWNGTATQVLGIAGSGLTSFNGQTDGTQAFANGATGTAPAFVSASGTHTLNIPLASGAGVTAGLISKADYDSFAAKQAALGYSPVNKAGDTMSGVLNMGDGVTNFNIANLLDPTLAHHAATKNYVDANVAGKPLAAPAAGQNGQAIRWNNGAGNWEYFTPNSGSVTSVSGTLPISVATGTSTPVISIADATAGAKGAMQVGSGLAVAAGVVSVDIGNTAGKVMGADAVPQCTAGQKLQMSAGPTFAWSCVADQGLTAETDPNVQAFAKAAPPTCGAGQVLKSDGTNLSCVADSATDASKLPLAGGTMTGAINMGGQDIAAAGNVALNAQKTLGLGIYTDGEETTLIGGLVAGDKGKTWYNSTSNQIKYWNGTATQVLGIAGSGLTSFNGQTGSSQSFAAPGTTGTAPAWSSNANVHTINIPLASGAGVTAGLLSKADYDSFAAKQNALGFTPVDKAGDTMTGLLVLSADPAANLGAATKQYVDSSIATAGGAYVKKDGSVTYTADQSMGGFKITSVADPAAAQDAATKAYVDSGLSGKQNSIGFTPVNKAGDTMSGALALPTNGLAVGTTQLVVSGGNIGLGTASPEAQLDIAGTGAILIPRGTTAQQPGTPVNGMLRYNSTTNKFEARENGAWVNMIASGGLTSLNGLTDGTQTFANGATGTAPAFVSASGTHTLNIPFASGAGVTAGLISKADYDSFAAKQAALGFTPVNKAGDTMTGALTLPANGLAVGTNQLVVTGGNVGIGTNSPYSASSALSIKSSVAAHLGSAINSGNSTLRLEYDGGASLGSIGGGVTFAQKYISSQGDMVRTGGIFGVKESADGGFGGGLAFYTQGNNPNAMNEVVRMTNSGLVGIGTASPAAQLDVAGTGAMLIPRGTTAQQPGTPVNGMLRYNSTTNKFEARENGAWVNMIASGGLTSLNGLTDGTQTFANGASGTAPAFVSASGTHTLNIPLASGAGVTGGLISKADYDSFAAKQAALGYTPVNKAGDSMTGVLNMGDGVTNFNIANLLDPTLAHHAATKNYVDTGLSGKQNSLGFTPVDKAGDTMTGLLVLSADPAANLGAATKQYTDSAVTTAVAAKVSKAGDTMTGSLTLPANGLVVGTNQLVVAGGNVGIGTASPGQKLEVSGNILAGGNIHAAGQISAKTQTIAGGTANIDWNNGNAILTDYNCASNVAFANMRDGGTYTLVITDTGTTQCNFSTTTTGTDAATVTYRFKPANGIRTASSYTVYTFMRIGTVVLVSWTSGF